MSCTHLSAWKAGRETGGAGCGAGAGGENHDTAAFLPVARALAMHGGRAGDGKVSD